MRVTANVIIDQPIRVVFAYVAGPSCWPEWMAGIRVTERRSARSLDVGDTFDRIDRRAANALRSTWEVTEHEPPRLLGCRRNEGGPPAFVRQVLESVGGSTRLTVCSEGEVSSVSAGGPEVEQSIAWQLERDLGGLKVLLERQEVDVGGTPTRRPRAAMSGERQHLTPVAGGEQVAR